LHGSAHRSQQPAPGGAAAKVAATPVGGNLRLLPRCSRGNEAHKQLVEIREIRVKSVSAFEFALCS
jgi:hypothetical protein